MKQLLTPLALVVAALAAAPVAARQQPSLLDILSASARYVDDLSERLQTVVADEDWLQLEVSGGAMRASRRLLSKVAFVGAGKGRLFAFRDVTHKDGNVVADDARLLRLFQPPTSRSLEDAQRLSQDAARHYVSRNMSVFDGLLEPLTLLRADQQPNVVFKLDGVKTVDGARLATVKFTERRKPYAITSPIDDPATGRLFIDVATGAVRRTELVISDRNVNLRLTVVYAKPAELDLWVPSQTTMQADISTPKGGDTSDKPGDLYSVRESLEARATFTKFVQVPFNLRH
jgi:hypothetical protein